MYHLEDFIINLEQYLTKSSNGSDSNIIKRHSRKLDTLGDVSFPANVSNWKRVFKQNANVYDEDILAYARKSTKPVEALLEESKNWPVRIQKCSRIKNHYHLFLDKEETFKKGIKNVLLMGDKYGTSVLDIKHNLHLNSDTIGNVDDSQVNVSELRVNYIKSVTENLLTFMGHTGDGLKEDLNIEFSLKSNIGDNANKKVIYCGPVLNTERCKNKATKEEYMNKRTVDMRMMAEHKYGVRLPQQPGWNEIWTNLAEASIIIELLQNTPSHSTVISLNNSCISSVKGAPFIMYNGARLVKILNEFEKKVTMNIYPILPLFDNIKISLLNQPEEWELFYVYVLQFPLILRTCIGDVANGRVNPHNLIRMLSDMVNVFSMYYRRVKILTEPMQHLFDILHARIFLLKCLSQVLFNSMRILNIKPVTQM